MNARLYCLMLRLYPAELRHDFGAEMTQVFLDDLKCSRLHDGLVGVMRTWWRSLKELFRLAIPAGISHRYIQVPLIMYVLQAFYLSGIVFFAHPNPASPVPGLLGEKIALILLFGLFPAAIVFVTLRIGDSAVPEPLSLSGRH